MLLVNAPSPSLCRLVGTSTNMTKASSTCDTPATTTDVNSNADYILCENMFDWKKCRVSLVVVVVVS